MKKLIQRLGRAVKGVLTGFDRIVFKGWLRPVTHADGAMSFCLPELWSNIVRQAVDTRRTVWLPGWSDSGLVPVFIDTVERNLCIGCPSGAGVSPVWPKTGEPGTDRES